MTPARRRAQLLALARKYGEAEHVIEKLTIGTSSNAQWRRGYDRIRRAQRALLAAAALYAREERRRG